ncbi:MAG: Gfo/Idh/MocA family oxidoreductase [Candidatus Eremiobacteraeota bacterium]|nr:Gfo/Idh/MocA family oxidoreductase [Candidatus Eremiobacteraeota bacterium]
MSRNALRLGVIGGGYWGQNLIRTCADLGVLDAICDADEGVRAALARTYPDVSLYDDYELLLEAQLDGVLIATPAITHADLAIAAFARGLHVFVEKPMALSVGDGQRMQDAADRAGRQLFIGHLLLYHPGVRKMRGLIADQAIGRVWHLRSRRLSLGKLRQHESVWWSFAPHDVALMLAIMGEEPESATSSQIGWLSSRLPDVAYADFQFSHGRAGHIEVNWLDPHKCARLDVYGTDGVITFEDFRVGQRLTVAMCGAKPDERGQLRAQRGDTYEVAVEPSEPLREEIIAFLTSIRFEIPSETDGKEGIAVLRALEMADDGSSHHSVVPTALA